MSDNLGINTGKFQVFEKLDKVNQAIQGAPDLQKMMSNVLDSVLDVLDCDRAYLLKPCDPGSPTWAIPMERTKPEFPGALAANLEIPMTPEIAETLRILMETDEPVTFGPKLSHPLPADVSEQFKIKSFVAMCIHPKIGKPWQFGIHQCSFDRVWMAEDLELFKLIGQRIADGLSVLLSYEELHDNRKFLDDIFENLPTMVFVKDAKDLRFIRLNRAGERLLGYSQQDLLGKNDHDFFTKEEADFFTSKDREVLLHKELVDIPEETIHTKSGERILHTKKIPLYDENGDSAYLVGISEDITERKHSEEALKKTSLRLNEAQRLAHIGSWELDLTQDILTWSEEIFHMFEIDSAKFGASYAAFLDAIHPEDREAVDNAYTNSVKNRTPYSIDHRLLFPDGRIKYVHERCETFYEGDKPSRSIGTIQDITIRKQSETALHHLNRELRAISNCNQTLLRADDELTLIKDICHIVCNETDYRMAWVGYAEQDKAKTVRPVAWAGAEDGYLGTVNITWADEERGLGPTGVAIRTGETACVQDFTSDPRVAYLSENASEHGYRSSIALPLKNNDNHTFGALCIYSSEPNTFTHDETRLLEELAGDLAFGITNLRLREEHKKAEMQIHVSEQRFRTLAENSPDNIARYDLNCHTVYVNPSLGKTLGHSIEDMMGKTPVENGLIDAVAEYQENILEVIRTGQAMEMDLVMPDIGDGQKFHNVRFVAEHGADGAVSGVLALGRDITERVHAEEALRESEQKFRGFVEESSEGFTLLDEQGCIIEWNRAREIMTGLHADQVLGKYLWDIQHSIMPPERQTPENYEISKKMIQEVIKTGKSPILHTVLEAEIMHQNGKRLFVQQTVFPIRTDKGYRIGSVTSDITARKQAEEALKQSEARYVDLYENAPDMYLSVNAKTGLIENCNQTLSDVIGRPKQGIIGKMIFDLYHPESVDQARQAFQTFIKTGEIHDQELLLLKSDGSKLHVSLNVKAVLDEDGNILSSRSTLRDITNRKRNDAIHAARLHLMQYADSHSIDELLEETLNEAEKLTDSSIAFYHFVADDQASLILQNWSTRTKSELGKAEGKGLHKAINKAGVWVECVDQQKPVIHNDYEVLPNKKGMPGGHAQLIRDLVVPVNFGNTIKAVLGVGNKPSDYDDHDIKTVELLAHQAWEIVEKKQAHRALQEREKHSESLLRLSRNLEQALTYTDILITAQNEVEQIIGYHNLWVYLATPDKKQFRALIAQGDIANSILDSEGAATLTIKGDKMLEEIAAANDVVIVEDARTDDRTNKEMVARLGNRSIVNVPILLFDRHLGTVGMGTFEEEGILVPTVLEREYLMTLASHMAVTLDRISLLNQRKKSEQALRESEERFRSLVTQAVDAFFLHDYEGRILAVNESACNSLGYQREELLSMSVFDIDVESESNRHKERFWDTLEPGQSATIEGQHRRKDGSTFPVEVRLGTLKLSNQKNVLALARDISDRKQAEDALRRSEEALRARERLLNESQRVGQVGGWDWDAETDCIWWSDEYYLIYGLEVGSPPPNYTEHLKAYTPESAARLNEAVQQAMEFGDPYELDLELAHPTPNTHWVVARCEVKRQDDGKIWGLRGTAQNITQRKRAEEALQEQQDLLLEAQRIAHIGNWWHDLETNEIFWSDEFFRILGIEPQKPTVEMATSIFHPDDLQIMLEAMESSSAGQIEHEQEFRVIRPDGEIRWIHNRWIRVNDEKGREIKRVGTHQDVTERKRAEQAIIDSEQKLTRFIANLPAFFFTFQKSAEGKYCFPYASPGIKTLYGLEPEEVREDMAPLHKLTHPDDRPIVETEIAQAFETLEPFLIEYRVTRPDLPERWLECRSVVVSEEDGNPLWHGIILDITDRKQIEDALRESESRFRNLVENAGDALFLHDDTRGHIIDVNEQACQSLGYTREELIGMTPYDFDASPDQTFIDEIPLTLAEGKSVISYTQHRRKDGSLFPVEIHTRPMLQGGRLFAISLARDITERKRIEERLHNLSHAIEQSPVSIMITDTFGNLEFVNKKFTEISGYSSAEVIGQNPRILKSGETPPEVYTDLWETISSGGVWRGEFRNRTKEGELFWEYAAISSVKDQNEVISHYVAVKEDINERKRLEEQLHQSQKMEAVGQLAGGVAHDFNNMLGVIIGYSDFALENTELDDSLRADLEEIRAAGYRSAEITRQLLTFARKQAILPKILDLNKTIEGTLKMIQRLIGEGVDLDWIAGDKLWSIKMDPSQIDQILVNLCVNARDAIGGFGKISIETQNITFDQAFCDEHTEFKPGEYVMLLVRDNGKGMDNATIRKIFEPFFTTKAVGKGTGLGLATVYGIVKQNAGNINVESEVGVGTTFRIYLARHEVVLKEATKSSEPKAELKGSETILLVEDEITHLRMLKLTLSKFGYEIFTATTPGEALNIVSENVKIDLLLTDVIMPEMNGRDLSNILLKQDPQMKCLFMSGYTGDVIAKHGVLNEGVSFIQKPFTVQELVAKVREVLDKP